MVFSMLIQKSVILSEVEGSVPLLTWVKTELILRLRLLAPLRMTDFCIMLGGD